MDSPDRVPGDQLPEAVMIARRRIAEAKNPRLRFMDHVVLKASTRLIKTATHWEIINEHTGELHHRTVRLESIPKATKAQGGGWEVGTPSKFTISDHDTDEIETLRAFLTAIQGNMPQRAGQYALIQLDGGDHVGAISRLLQAASSTGKAEFLVDALDAVGGDAAALWDLARLASDHPDVSRVAAAALNLAHYDRAPDRLSEQIDADANEETFQRLLTENPWMFGSEYSELVDRRDWVRDHQNDFMLRRTVDNYLEIVEIKTPLGRAPLFLLDQSHDSYYARNELTRVIGQVQTYLEEVDADRNAIERRDREKVNKIQAKVIIGRDGDEAQMDALRRYNSHLNRIEVLTFDQLLQIGRRVRGHFEHVIDPPLKDDVVLGVTEAPF